MLSRRTYTDIGFLAKFPRNGAGAVRVPATISRTGVQVYPGDEFPRQYRPPESVFAADSIASLASIPVTFGHPREGVSPNNARSLTIGHVTDAAPETRVTLDGSPYEWLRTTVVVSDGQALDEIDAGAAREVSCGYNCELDCTPGVSPTGEAYDAIQKNIIFNHVAILPCGDTARAGAEAKLRLDATKDIMKVILIDGVEYEVGSEKHLAKLDANHNAALKVERDRADREHARADAAEERATKAEALTTSDATEARVEARLALIQRAGKFLPGTYDTKGKSDAQIRADVVTAKLGADKVTGKSEVYIEARFDGLSEEAEADKAQYHNPASVKTDQTAPVATDIGNDDSAFRDYLKTKFSTMTESK